MCKKEGEGKRREEGKEKEKEKEKEEKTKIVHPTMYNTSVKHLVGGNDQMALACRSWHFPWHRSV